MECKENYALKFRSEIKKRRANQGKEVDSHPLVYGVLAGNKG